jgi:hypothetical protein
MDIKELDKKQLVLLTLLITFVVSIATGIVTVSLMNQMPKSVPQTINNVIQRTIERVTTVQVPAPAPKATDKANSDAENSKNNSALLFGNGDALVNIYSNKTDIITPVTDTTSETVPVTDTTDTTGVISPTEPVAIGQGVIISDIGLILVDSSILTEEVLYKVILNKIDFDATVLKKFNNGFAILKISEKKTIVETPVKSDATKTTQ